MRIRKYPNKVKIVGKGGCVKHYFSGKKEHGDLLFVLACWIQHYISTYVNIKIIYPKYKKTAENVFKALNNVLAVLELNWNICSCSVR